MKIFYTILRLILLLLIASTLYVAGAINASLLLVTLGLAFELVFWLALLDTEGPGRNKKPT